MQTHHTRDVGVNNMDELKEILTLEEKGFYEEVYKLYKSLYEKNKANYSVWEHYYFLIWTSIEDAPRIFQEKINRPKLLQELFVEGKANFNQKPEFNFIAGYTASIFPYEYGKYLDIESVAKKMLLKATNKEPENKIYRLVYLGSQENIDSEIMKKAELEAIPFVMKKYEGIGLLNKYFRQVLVRIN